MKGLTKRFMEVDLITTMLVKTMWDPRDTIIPSSATKAACDPGVCFAGVLYNQFLSQSDFETLKDYAEVSHS